MPTPHIFVSHSHYDNVACRSIVEYLRQHVPGAAIFFDESELHGGDEWLRRIQHEVLAANIFIVVLSPRSVAPTAEWVLEETNLALKLVVEARKRGERRLIIPVRVDPALTDEAILQFAPLLTLRQTVDLVPGAPGAHWQDLVRVARGEQSDQAPQAALPAATVAVAEEYEEARDLAAQVGEAVRQGQWPTAVRLGRYAAGLPGNSQDATFLGDYARALISVGQVDLGLATLKPALTLNKRRSDLWQLQAQTLAARGQALTVQGQPNEANTAWDAAVAAWDMAFITTAGLEGRLALLREQYTALRAAGRHEQATAVIAEALSLAPQDAAWLALRRAEEQEWHQAEERALAEHQRREQEQRQRLRREAEAFLNQYLTPRLKQLGFHGHVTDAGQAYIVPPLATVAAGPFTMGSQGDPQAGSNEPRQQVTLPAYTIGLYPLTVAEWACAVRAGAVEEPPQGTYRPITWQEQLKHLDHPVVCVSWLDLQRYVTWLSGLTGEPWRLPTEAEWEKAARGTDGRIYPWGNGWDKTRANTSDGGPGGTTPVGQYAERGDASPSGCHDMAGNVWEWCSTIYIAEPYQLDIKRENNNDHDNRRVLRGGAWNDLPQDARAAQRYHVVPAFHDVDVGARLVRARPPLSH